MRLAGAGVQVPQLTAVFLTHLHSDHTTDFNDVITTWWVMPMTAGRRLTVIGPAGTQAFVDRTIAAMSADIGYRIDHHADINEGPGVDVIEVSNGVALESGNVTVQRAPRRPRRREACGRIPVRGRGRHGRAGRATRSPCDGLDGLCRDADVYVQTVIRRDLVEQVPVQRFLDIIDYHSDVSDAAQHRQARRRTHAGAEPLRPRAAARHRGRVDRRGRRTLRRRDPARERSDEGRAAP